MLALNAIEAFFDHHRGHFRELGTPAPRLLQLHLVGHDPLTARIDKARLAGVADLGAKCRA